jgi:hypothetical protein
MAPGKGDDGLYPARKRIRTSYGFFRKKIQNPKKNPKKIRQEINPKFQYPKKIRVSFYRETVQKFQDIPGF